MEDILDFDENNDYKDVLFLQKHQLSAVVDLLTKHDIVHKVYDIKHLDDVGFVPLNTNTDLSRSAYRVKVPENLHLKVEELMEAHPEILNDSRAVRKLFLERLARDDYFPLVDVLLFPEEWMDRDQELALEILTEKGIHIPVEEYAERRKEREKVRENSPKVGAYKNRLALKLFAWILLLSVLMMVYSYITTR